MKCICQRCNMDLVIYFDRTREFSLLAEVEELANKGYSRHVLYCPTCESNQEFRISTQTNKENTMSHETGNPDLEGITPMNPPPVMEQNAALLSPEAIQAILGIATETAQAIADIPAQMEFQAFTSLSMKFMYPMEGGKVGFNEESFLKVWARLNALYENQQKGA